MAHTGSQWRHTGARRASGQPTEAEGGCHNHHLKMTSHQKSDFVSRCVFIWKTFLNPVKFHPDPTWNNNNNYKMSIELWSQFLIQKLVYKTYLFFRTSIHADAFMRWEWDAGGRCRSYVYGTVSAVSSTVSLRTLSSHFTLGFTRFANQYPGASGPSICRARCKFRTFDTLAVYSSCSNLARRRYLHVLRVAHSNFPPASRSLGRHGARRSVTHLRK